MQVRHLKWGGDDFVSIYGEGKTGEVGRQLAELLDRIETELAAAGLSLDDAVFHRLWSRTREGREEVGAVRERRFAGNRRTASSSFIAARRLAGPGDVALEVIARRASPGEERRLFDFEPPRRYAHYMVSGRWLFLSGMAETGDSMEQRFTRAMAELEVAMRTTSMGWGNVVEATLFMERGKGTLEWLRQSFLAAVPIAPDLIAAEYVDGLASTDKHLEIEIVARR